MSTSLIVFAGIIVGGLACIPLIFRSAHRLFKEFLRYKDKQEHKQQQQKIEQTKNELKETVNNGSLADLFDVADKLGEDKKKKESR